MSRRRLQVLSIFGTRPEAVKMAPVVQALQQEPRIEASVCVTAQHRQMLDQVLQLFEIRPDFDLNLMRPDQSLAELTAAVFTHLEPVLQEVKPDWILVQGDTTTVMATALLAYYRQIKVGHVEAGLRTFDKWAPFPEEINRRVAGVVADLHFAPTAWARDNLRREGVADEIIHVTGNTVIDALQSIVSKPFNVQQLLPDIAADRRVILVTAHRRENFGRPLQNIFQALLQIAQHFPDTAIVYPVHLNPNVREPARRMLAGVENIFLLDPLDYLPMVHLMQRAELILTDSGGIQEEAPALGVPVLVLRDKTERPEAIEAGTARLVGTDSKVIVTEATRLLQDQAAYAAMARASNPFGDGHAAERIVAAILDHS